MLYIDDVGNNTVKFASTSGGANDVYYANTLSARSDELDLVWIVDAETNSGVLNCCPASEITLNGVVYVAENFVQAFNAMMAGVAYVPTTTTTTTATPVTTTTTTAAVTTTTTTAAVTTTTTTAPVTTTTTTAA